MKKLVLFAAVVVAVSLASCKQKTVETVVEEGEAIEAIDTVVPADTIVEAIAVEAVEAQ